MLFSGVGVDVGSGSEREGKARELEGAKGGEAVVRVHYMKEE